MTTQSSPTPGAERFVKKPIAVEAWRWERGASVPDGCEIGPTFTGANSITIVTLEGEMTVHDGDWIVKGVAGEFYPVRADIFERTYAPQAPTGPEAVDHHGDEYDEMRYNTELIAGRSPTLIQRVYVALEPFADDRGALPAATAYEVSKAIVGLIEREKGEAESRGYVDGMRETRRIEDKRRKLEAEA